MGLTEGEVCFEVSAAASSSLLASLAAGQCRVGGRMLGSNFNSISLHGNQKKDHIRSAVILQWTTVVGLSVFEFIERNEKQSDSLYLLTCWINKAVEHEEAINCRTWMLHTCLTRQHRTSLQSEQFDAGPGVTDSET